MPEGTCTARSGSLGRVPVFDYTSSVNARIRQLLLMLLMLTLPLQAVASAAMLGCMLAHPAGSEPSAMADEMMAGCHESSDRPDTPTTSHNCTHCAVCALASALAIPVADSTPVVPLTVRFLSQPDAEFSGFIPDGPERPPRPFLA